MWRTTIFTSRERVKFQGLGTKQVYFFITFEHKERQMSGTAWISKRADSGPIAERLHVSMSEPCESLAEADPKSLRFWLEAKLGNLLHEKDETTKVECPDCQEGYFYRWSPRLAVRGIMPPEEKVECQECQGTGIIEVETN